MGLPIAFALTDGEVSDFKGYGSKAQLLRARKQNNTGLGIYVKGEGWKIMSLDEAIHARLTEAL